MEEIEKMLEDDNGTGDAKPGELGKSLQRLDEIVKDAGSGLHPRLRHFLENRSYGKAFVVVGGWRTRKRRLRRMSRNKFKERKESGR